jgi:hypothetical protein
MPCTAIVTVIVPPNGSAAVEDAFACGAPPAADPPSGSGCVVVATIDTCAVIDPPSGSCCVLVPITCAAPAADPLNGSGCVLVPTIATAP